MFEPNSQSFIIDNLFYGMGVGDIDSDSVEHNTSNRSYISFLLPNIPDGFYVDSVYVQINPYPILNLPADTIICRSDSLQ